MVVGTTNKLVLIGPNVLRVFRGAFLRWNSSPSYTSCVQDKEEGQHGELLSS